MHAASVRCVLQQRFVCLEKERRVSRVCPPLAHFCKIRRRRACEDSTPPMSTRKPPVLESTHSVHTICARWYKECLIISRERETHPRKLSGLGARQSVKPDNSSQDHGSPNLFENVQANRVLLMLRMLKTALWPEVYKCVQADTHTHTHARAASSFAPLLRAVASCARASAADA